MESDQSARVPSLAMAPMRTRNCAPGEGAVTTLVRRVHVPSEVHVAEVFCGVKLTWTSKWSAPGVTGQRITACAPAFPGEKVTSGTFSTGGGDGFDSAREGSPALLMMEASPAEMPLT